MKPLKLKIKGINSFLDQQEINFDKLLKGGIFGIFGPTGSGKSTVLDALILALYDKIPRRSKEFINKDADKAYVCFEFEIYGADGKTVYTVERSYKKAENAFYKASGARLTMKTDLSEKIIADKSKEVTKNIIDIIGLGYEDFTRSVVLPQGKFSEFLTLADAERRNMLERILHLEKYGVEFLSRIKERKLAAKEELSILLAKLEAYDGITTENLNRYKENADKLKCELKEKESDLEEKTAVLEKNRIIYQFCSDLSEKIALYNNLIKMEPEIKNKKMAIELTLNAESIMPLINDYIDIKAKMEKAEECELKCNEELKGINDLYNSLVLLYEEAKNRKNNDLPNMIIKKQNIMHAIDIKNVLSKLEAERVELGKEYIKYKNELNDILKEKENTEQKRESIKKRQQEIEKEKSDLFVSTDLRNNINKGVNYENNLEAVDIEIKALKNKQDIRLKELNNLLKEQNNICENLKNLEEEQNEYNNKKEKLEKECPDKNLLKDLQEKLPYFLERLKYIKKAEDDIVESNEKLENINKSLNLKNNEKTEQQIKLDEFQKKTKELSEKYDFIERSNIASYIAQKLEDFKPCPVCGSLEHPSPAKEITDVLKEDILKEKTAAENETEKIQNNINNLSVQIAALEADQTNFKKIIEQAENIIKDESSSKIESEIKRLNSDIENLKAAVDKYENESKEILENIQNLSNKIAEYKNKDAVCNEKINSSKKSLEEIENDLKLKCENKDNFCNCILELKEKIKTENTFKSCADNLSLKDDKRNKLEDEEKYIKESLNDIEKSLEEIGLKISEKQTLIDVVKTRGTEKRKLIDSKREEIKALSESENLDTDLNITEKEIEKIVEDEKNLNKKVTDLRDKHQKLKEELAKAESDINTYKDIYIDKESKIENELKKHNFNTIEEVKQSLLEKDITSEYLKAVENFENKKISLENNINELKEKSNGNYVSKEDMQELIDDVEKAKGDLNNISNEAAVCKNTIEDFENKLIKLQEIEKEKDKAEHNYSLLDDISKIMAGNKLVEYMALNHLSYITAEASKRLKAITYGRYSLELYKNEFIMRDDFNGGTRRKPDTLSGGEVFLTSFSLALALSSKIQMKNKSPLRFFFLDEGFGTLDSGLLDTVMTSLENLKNEDLCIGVISHVEELKSRIQYKLMISPPAYGVRGSETKLDIG